MHCSKPAAPGKALCEQCFAEATQRHASSAKKPTPEPRSSSFGTIEPIAETARDEQPVFSQTPEPEVERQRPPQLLRLLAYLADSALIMLVSYILFRAGAAALGINLARTARLVEERNMRALLMARDAVLTLAQIHALATLVPAWIYFTAFETGPMQATPAKALLGLSVWSGDGRPAADAATKRFLIKYLPVLLPLVLIPVLSAGCFAGMLAPFLFLLVCLGGVCVLINPLMVLFTYSRRGLHDVIAGTSVSKTAPAGAAGVAACLAIILFAVVARVGMDILMRGR